ncbi:MAG TPA: FRG domain-containing protein [Bryobacteraceae bacterium]|nr:FRG domain-containing protein [Bryobacteraceae bacterium]
MVEHVARLAYSNPDELLFFRGQNKDYQSRAGGTTLYPAIYRGDSLPNRELRHRFELLDEAARLLIDKFRAASIEGHRELRQKRYIQWSILQHYEVTATPLLDVTQSLRVACSFAQIRSADPTCFVYVLGLPYVANRISINSEHDLVNVRLLSICPPAALRPYFQEGFLAGTTDVTFDFDSKTDLDFRNRLIAKFEIPRDDGFWDGGFDKIPEAALYPVGDHILELCASLRTDLAQQLRTGDVGEFIREWAAIEEYLMDEARKATARNISIREAIGALEKQGTLTSSQAVLLDSVRKIRNVLVHEPNALHAGTLAAGLNTIRHLRQQLRPEPPGQID